MPIDNRPGKIKLSRYEQLKAIRAQKRLRAKSKPKPKPITV